MENNNSANALLEKRRQMFEKMGIKSAGQINESAVENAPKNLSMAQRLQQIKSGAAKSELNKYVQASSKSAGGSIPGVADFSPIPETKARTNPNAPQQQVNPNYKVSLDTFGGSTSRVDNSELSMIDAMFGGAPSASMNPYNNSFDNGQSIMQNRPMNTQLDLDNTLGAMPSFNPEYALQRAQSKASSQKQNNGNSFLQFAQHQPIANQEDYVVQSNYQDQHQTQQMGITPAMKMMMESIAKTMAEQTIKRVLSDFTENQKNKMFFEVYNKEKSIIKTSDGKLYKLTPVQIRKG